MHILVSGGTGLIGQAFCRALTRHGHTVSILSRNPSRYSLPDINTIAWDGKTGTGWINHLEQADAIVNLAGESLAARRWTKTQKLRILESRVQAGQAILNALTQARHKPAVLMQASAVGYYGPREDEPVDETTPPGTDFLARVCQGWEESTRPVEAMGLRRIILRTGIVLSKLGGALNRLLLPFQFFAGGPIGSGRQWVPWIHLQDQVEGMCFLLENEKASGPFNLSSPNPVTNAEFAKILGQVYRRPSWLHVPAFAMKMLLGEMSTVVLDGQKAMPLRLQQLNYSFQYPDLHHALEQIAREG